MDYFSLIKPAIYALSPEKAHNAAIFSLKHNLLPSQTSPANAALEQTLWGVDFPNPVGLSAGFDKNAEALSGLSNQGFGFVEVGTVTPRPQPGNPKPRIFRLNEDEAIINRLGFNNKGLEVFVSNLKAWRATDNSLIIGANIGKNKTTENAAEDYCEALDAVYDYCDYITVNISSPNTPGLRKLQSKEAFDALATAILKKKAEHTEKNVPILFKIAPDVSDEELEIICNTAKESRIDGLIISNTTIQFKDTLKSAHALEEGGLSGKPLFPTSTDVLARAYRHTEGCIPLVGVGGISNGREAYEKILAGASLVQLYTALIYQGFGLISRINNELLELLKSDGFSTISDAVGQAAKK
jgi:dihydroorotate dehydrogenase